MSDFYSSIFVGMAQTAVGHPFDTLKVLYQNKNSMNNFKLTSLYRGWKFPMFSASIINSTIYPVCERSYKYTNNIYLSGGLAGLIASPIIYSLDVGKIKQQVNQPLKLKDLYKTKGLLTTVCRDVPGMSFFFGTYHSCKNMGMDPLVAGGIAGFFRWSSIYPIDVIRTRQMARNISIRQAVKEKQLWRGYSVCALRSVIVNAVNFKVYETAKLIFDSKI
jgi:solute carrier family 25 carnitine/acylcarnitine transporter 20/29